MVLSGCSASLTPPFVGNSNLHGPDAARYMAVVAVVAVAVMAAVVAEVMVDILF